MPNSVSLTAATAALLLAASGAGADVVISSAATSNMSCTNGVCVPTAKDAVLNAGDLESLLAAGNVEVATTGSGVQADDIVIATPLTWSDTATLALDAWRSVTVQDQVSVAGQGGLAFTTNNGGKNGELSFTDGGDATFQNLASQLTINGNAYTLVNSVSALASAIAANPKGNFALANSYDASGDGTYTASPVLKTLRGDFEGLGNAISNVTIISKQRTIGLFGKIKLASIRDVKIININISGTRGSIGALVGLDTKGTIGNSFSTGTISSKPLAYVGGLVGYMADGGSIIESSSGANISGGWVSGGLVGNVYGGNPKITLSYATGNVIGKGAPVVGGLVGQSVGTITESFATGNVSALNKHASGAGGLVGNNSGVIKNCYATGSASANWAGGLAGNNNNIISGSYSSGKVNGESYSGGLVGQDRSPQGSISYSYWDTTTSGILNLTQGAGNISNDSGITGLSTKQFRSGLPGGFNNKIWHEKRRINGGLPYLISEYAT